MITESFDSISEPIITPMSFFGEKKHLCDIAIATFSREIYSSVLERYEHEQVGEICTANHTRPIYLLAAGGMKIGFYLSEIGSALASSCVIDVNWQTGAEKFIMFGSAGALDNDVTAGKYVIPTDAYRDEGLSYHYAPPADYIAVRNAERLAAIFDAHRFPYVMGKVWTTDAFYRETREMLRRRKADGCIAVEMELAGVQAVCDYHGFELYDFLVTGDVIDQPEYTPDGLYEANHSRDKFDVAMVIAESIGT